MKSMFLTTLVCILCFQSCIPFKDVSKTKTDRSEIFGVYFNDCDSIDNKFQTKMQLWQTIDKRYKGKQNGLIVKLEKNQKNKIFAQLLIRDSVICEKTIKGNFKYDQCYYKRSKFYVVPILPILWWFKNTQTRLYSNQNYLILEEKIDQGGVVVFMAGGNNSTTKRLYKRDS